MTYLLTK